MSLAETTLSTAGQNLSRVREDARSINRIGQIRHLSQSVILDEVGPPRLAQIILLLFSATVFAFFIWASLITIAETTKATGEIIPTGSVLSVQHLEGGIVSKILVREGDLVEAGTVLIQLSPTAALAELEVLESRRAALSVRAERLIAFARERTPDFSGIATQFADLINDQRVIFTEQSEARNNKLTVMRLDLGQRKNEIDILSKQAIKFKEKVGIISERKKLRSSLLVDGLVSKIVYLNTLQELNVAKNEYETVLGKIQRAKQAVEESESKIIELKLKLSNEALMEMGTTKAELGEVQRSINRSRDRVKRLRITSPVRGIVKELRTHTVGGVIAPGGVISDIVPVDKELVVEARFSPVDVGHLTPGLKGKIKITTFDFARFGVIEGTVENISATTFKDSDGNVYYKAMVKLAKNYVGDDPKKNILLPGMVAEIDIKTGERTLLRYLLRPIYQSLDAAFSER